MPDDFIPANTHILIVDDSNVVRMVLGKILKKAGYPIQACADGEDALAALDSGAFDLMLMDFEMPGLHGFDLLDLVKTKAPELPVALMTAHTDPAVFSEARQHGAAGFVEKPFPDADQVLEKVKSFISSS